jgi:hypothetical protein
LVAAVAVAVTGCEFQPKTKIRSKTAAVVTAPPELELTITGATSSQILFSPSNTVKIDISADRDISYWCLSETQTTAPRSIEAGCAGGEGENQGWSAAPPTQFTLAAGEGPRKLYAWAYGTNKRFSITPATADITIDGTPPTLSINALPAYSKSTSLSVTWASSDVVSGFDQCRYQLDGGAQQACPSPITLTGLPDGTHTVHLVVLDKAGNQRTLDASTIVDLLPPSAAFNQTPAAMTNQTTADFAFTLIDVGSSVASVQCRLDGGTFSACASPVSFSGLPEGNHQLSVLATDQAGNSSMTPFSWMVDVRPPTITISAGPALTTNLATAHYVFAAADANSGVARMECQLDTVGYTPCTSPLDYTALAIGTHRFDVRAVDRAGNTSAAQSETWTIDSGAPVTVFNQQPSTPTKIAQATFAWTSTDPSGVASETCSLDAATPSLCLSPVTLPTLADGSHVFTVRATDIGGTAGMNAITWVIDTIPPVTAVTASPPPITNQSSATFQFTATDATTAVATIECQLDNTGYSNCASPITFSGLASATHLFELRATDQAGNTSLPISYVWQVDLVPPVVTFTAQPPVITRATSASFTFTVTDNILVAARDCSLDGAAFATCTSPVSLTGLSSGNHAFSVRGTDTAGNATIATANWTIDPNFIAPELQLAATNVGKQYDCPLATSIEYNAGNVGYDYIQDQQTYAAAKTMVDHGCLGTTPRSVTFLVSTVNFPSDGTATGTGAGVKGAWLQYWDDLATRWSTLGFKIVIEPFPYIINDLAENTTLPGLRWLKSTDLNLAAAAIPEVFSCRDGRKTVLASIYDTRTLDMGKTFYMGIKSFFSKYTAFDRIAIVPPSDLGEHAFPVGITSAWWKGSDDVANCFKTGDTFAKLLIATDPPSAANYNGKLNQFRLDTYTFVAAQFPGKKILIYQGRANDDPTGPGGFTYSEVTGFAGTNSLEIRSLQGLGANAAVTPLDKVTLSVASVPALPATTTLTLEDSGLLFEMEEMRNLVFSGHYGASSHSFYPDPVLNSPYLMALSFGLGPAPIASLFTDKGSTFTQFNGLGTFRNAHLTQSTIETPAQASVVSPDISNAIDGWAYFDTYGDKRNEKVLMYAGPLSTDSKFNTGGTNPNSNAGAERTTKGRDPQFMRLVGQTTTMTSRTIVGPDTSRYALNWKPDLANGSAIVRFFLANSEAGIVAELPASPIVITVSGKTTGKYTINRTGFDGTHLCSNTFTIAGTARVTGLPVAGLDVVILDEYRGTILSQGTTDAAGAFSIPLTVPKQAGGAYPAFRAYVYFDNNGDAVKDLVALPMDLSTTTIGGLGYNRIGNVDWTVTDCP